MRIPFLTRWLSGKLKAGLAFGLVLMFAALCFGVGPGGGDHHDDHAVDQCILCALAHGTLTADGMTRVALPVASFWAVALVLGGGRQAVVSPVFFRGRGPPR